MQDNKLIKGERNTLKQPSRRCPVCGKKLVYFTDSQTINNYEIVPDDGITKYDILIRCSKCNTFYALLQKTNSFIHSAVNSGKMGRSV